MTVNSLMRPCVEAKRLKYREKGMTNIQMGFQEDSQAEEVRFHRSSKANATEELAACVSLQPVCKLKAVNE